MSRERYVIVAVVHTVQVVSAFGTSLEPLPFAVVVKRAALGPVTVFRHLYTLEQCGLIEKAGRGVYRPCPGLFYTSRTVAELSAITS